MSSLLRMSMASNLVLVMVHCSMRAKISFSRDSRAGGVALLVARLDACEVEHAVLHRHGDALTLPGHGALVERGEDAEPEMQPGAAVADLRAGHERQSVAEARGRCRTAGALRDVL